MEGLVDVEQWAELRREHFVRGVSIKELVRRTGLSRNTVRAALRSPEPPRYQRAQAGSKLDPFKDEIHALLGRDPAMTGQRIRELIAPLGFPGGKTIVDDYLREVRPFFVTIPVWKAGRARGVRPTILAQFDRVAGSPVALETLRRIVEGTLRAPRAASHHDVPP